MKKSKNIPLLIGISLLVFNTYAGDLPKVLSYADGEQFHLALSKINFNRIYVEGEKIVKISLPQNTFVVDKSDINDTQSREGSIYLKPLYDVPLTVFFTTDKDHHFSITANADASDGKTYKLMMRNLKTKIFVSTKAEDVVLSEDVISDLKEGVIPHDYINEKIKPRAFYVKKNVRVFCDKQFKSTDKTAYVCRLENKGRDEIALKTSLFNQQNADFLELSTETLKPKQIAYLYGLYNND
ncbi:MAG: type-F conjugative transfer system secretin TraK [Legionella sp.]|nr:MAG: type-F conjugative transfer system secretin TraK [Legionella sp.]